MNFSRSFLPPLDTPSKTDEGMDFERELFNQIGSSLERMAHEWCPVCRRFVKDSEIHMVGSNGCTRVTGLGSDPTFL